jgi:transposase-like protein
MRTEILLDRESGCPKCKKGQLTERVKRNTLIRVFLFWLPIKRYKCWACNRKSHILIRERIRHTDRPLMP